MNAVEVRKENEKRWDTRDHCNLGDGTLCFVPIKSGCIYAGMCAAHCNCDLDRKHANQKRHYRNNRDVILARRKLKKLSTQNG